MSRTSLVLGDNWAIDEWPDSVDVMHVLDNGNGYVRDSLEYVPEKALRLACEYVADCQDECPAALFDFKEGCEDYCSADDGIEVECWMRYFCSKAVDE